MKYHNIPIAALILFAVSLFISPKIFSGESFLPEGMTMDEFVAAVNDSNLTMDSIKNQLSADGEWIKVGQDEIDAESVTDGSTEFDDDINTDYVWRPNNVPENWSPYTNGYWTYTSCGWMWVSNYSWGWRPYHYGRWWWSARWGWVWSPGFIWGPAWVVWMFWDNYCGWYPLSPRVRWHHHHHRYYCGHLRYRVRHWVFVPRRHFCNITINNTVIVDPNSYSSILQKAEFNSSIDYTNGTVVNSGPNVTEIEKSAGKKYEPVDVKKYNTPRKVNEYVNREIERENKEDIQKKQEAQKQQEVNKNQNSQQNNETRNNNSETKSRNEDSRKENNSTKEKNTYNPNSSTKEDNSYKEKPKEFEQKQNNENKQNNESKQKNNDGYNNNKQKNNDSYNSNRNSNNNNNNKPNDNNKTTTPRNEQKSSDSQSNKNNNSGSKNNNNRSNDSKDGDAQNNRK